MIELDRVSYRVGGHLLIDGVSCVIPAGRFTAVLGVNGSGKTTLVRLLAGECVPAAGAVRFGGRALTKWPLQDLAQRRAVVPQVSTLSFGFRVLDVVLMGRLPHAACPGHADLEIAEASLAAVGLTPLAERDYTTLSGGERQRVHLARALAQLHEARRDGAGYLLLDEATAHLDLCYQWEVLSMARELADAGLAVIAVLHDLNQALRFADRALVLDGGRLIHCDEPDRVLDADFVERTFGVAMASATAPDGTPALFPIGTGPRRPASAIPHLQRKD